MLLVSGTDFGARVAQHSNVIRAAAAAGVELLAYTSAPYADTTSMQLAAEHLATERVLLDAGVPYALLRNGWYAENYAAPAAAAIEQGELVGATDGGRVSVAARADYAEAAAVVVGDLDGQGHQGSTYELGGEPGFTFAELAAELSRLSGREIVNRNVSVAELEQILVGAGLPAPAAAVFADVDRAIGAGRAVRRLRRPGPADRPPDDALAGERRDLRLRNASQSGRRPEAGELVAGGDQRARAVPHLAGLVGEAGARRPSWSPGPGRLRTTSGPGAGRWRTHALSCSVGTQPRMPRLKVGGGAASTASTSESGSGSRPSISER